MKKVVIFDMGGVFLKWDLFLIEKVDPKMVQLLHELKEEGYKVLLLSNIFFRDSAYYKKKFRFLELFDACYFSSDIGFAKPDPEAYRYVLTANNLKPEECVFFDDKKVNIAAAKKLGIEAYVFAGAEAAKEKIL